MKKRIKKGVLDTLHHLSFYRKIEIEILFIILLLCSGTLIFHLVEGWRTFDALYFTVTTMAAVGYGDFVPKTDLGKSISMIYMMVGMPLFIYTSALLVERRLMRRKE
ncbi:hypothetical protein AUK10_02075 [Candidatus Gracilibacteria bacterium CG2_30_37_12]|nr:MAG: hypothetical protein AUK10_02075 [Candidatus Gracilibacteria bacterium CG2_30_37_12]